MQSCLYNESEGESLHFNIKFVIYESCVCLLLPPGYYKAINYRAVRISSIFYHYSIFYGSLLVILQRVFLQTESIVLILEINGGNMMKNIYDIFIAQLIILLGLRILLFIDIIHLTKISMLTFNITSS